MSLPAAFVRAAHPGLEDILAGVEARMTELDVALRARDPTAIEQHAAALHRALAQAVEPFARAARSAPVTASLRPRLDAVGATVAAQREALARATAALDRAIDVLLPRGGQTLYSNAGGTSRTDRRGGVLQA